MYGKRGKMNVIEIAAMSMKILRCPAHLSEMKPVSGVASDPAMSKLANRSEVRPESPYVVNIVLPHVE